MAAIAASGARCVSAADAAPLDTAFYRTGAVDPRVRQTPDDLRKGIAQTPEQHLPRLVQFLVEGATDPFLKTKRIHDWIADNIQYDVQSYFSPNRAPPTSQHVLTSGRSVCHGYSSLMEAMCQQAGIPCRTIFGYGRGYGFVQNGGDLRLDQSNHAWNAVYIAERWHLVDATWNAGVVVGREYRKSYRTSYLFMAPENFVYTHLPADPSWQLLATPLSAEQFQELPYVRPDFFDLGLALRTTLSRTTRVKNGISISIACPDGIELMAALHDADGKPQADRTLVQRDAGGCALLALPPAGGRYRGQLYGRPAGATQPMHLALEFDIDAAEGTPRLFPTVYAAFGKMRGRLEGPLTRPLPTDRPVEFRLRLHDVHDVNLAVGDGPWRPFVRDAADPALHTLTASIPAGAPVRIVAKETASAARYTTLVEYP